MNIASGWYIDLNNQATPHETRCIHMRRFTDEEKHTMVDLHFEE